MKRKILIDCDPGFDDALAIIAAHKIKEVDIIGLTVTAGNASLKNTSKNALNLLDTLGWNIPVALGASGPLVIKRDLSHEKTGIGNIKLEDSSNKFHSSDALDYIYETAKSYEGELEILALAPMTNIALALKKYPDLKHMIKSITFMGGTMDKGNIRPWAEFNVYVDPHATDIVFNSGIPITMIGLDITKKAVLSLEDMAYFKLLKSIHGDLVAAFLQGIYERECLFEESNIEVHDLVALYCMIYPEKVKTRKFRVAIEKNNENRGMLILDYREITQGEHSVDIGIALDEEAFRQWVKELFKDNLTKNQ